MKYKLCKQQLLSAQETWWLRRTVCVRKRRDQEWIEYLRTGKRLAHTLRVEAVLPALWHRAAKAVHGWAGHLARREEGHPARDVVFWRSTTWWRMTQAVGAGSGSHTWRHPRRNWRPGWEKVLADTWTPDWWVAARNRGSWADRASTFTRTWIARWGGPPALARRRI